MEDKLDKSMPIRISSRKHSNSSIFAILVAVLAFTGCEKMEQKPVKLNASNINEEKNFNFQENMGWVHGNCLAIKRELKPGEKATLIIFGQEKSVHIATIEKEASAGSGCFALFDDRKAINKSDGRFFYTLDGLESKSEFLAVGIVGKNVKVKFTDNIPVSDLDKNGRTEVYTSCETSEGINFHVWSENAYHGTPIWSDYYYLGYDIQSTCP